MRVYTRFGLYFTVYIWYNRKNDIHLVKRYSLQIPASTDISSAVRSISEYIFAEIGFSELQISRLKLVFDEIFMNAVKYGSLHGSSLYITFEFENGTLRVCFEDEGGEKNISAEDLQKIIAQQKSNDDPQKKSGRGLAQIAQRWADDLKVWNGTKGGLCVAFYKKLEEKENNEESQESQKTKNSPLKKVAKLKSKTMSIAGEVDDINLSEHVKEVDTFVESAKAPCLLILDFGELKFCNSSFIAKTVSWHQSIREKGGELVVQNTPDNILEIFELVGITQIIHITTSKFENEKDTQEEKVLSKKEKSGKIEATRKKE